MRPTLSLLTRLLLGVLVLASVPAEAQQTAVLRTSSFGLDGLDRTAWPQPQPNFAVAGTAGYGLTEAIPGGGDGIHQRLTGTLAGGVTLPKKASFLSLGLRFDGRLDFHPAQGGNPAYATGVGDPRVVVRGGHALNERVQLGADAILWIPGESAPSFDFSASTVDFRVLTAYEPESIPLSLLGFAGFRLDNSAKAAPDLNRVRPGDRIALGLSDSSAVLLGVGLNYAVTKTVQVFGEVSGDLLVGPEAPSIGESPWRASIGARYPLLWFMVGELKLSAALSKRPPIGANDPLVPIEPRFSVDLGLRFGKSLKPPPPPEAEPEPEPEPAPPPPPDADGDGVIDAEDACPQEAGVPSDDPAKAGCPLPTHSSLAGQILDADGQPLPDALVKLQLADGTTQEAFTDGDGRFDFERVAVGEATLHVSAALFDDLKATVDITGDPNVDPARKLERHEPGGTLRGLARSFASEPLQATIRVMDRRGRMVAEVTAGEDGTFELPLKPGSFKLRISAPGYSSQRRTIRISDNGVTVLNVDLRERK